MVTNLLLICLLIALSAFFVASEFAIVRVRPSRIEQLITEGNPKAILAKNIISHLDSYLSACQLGITITSLGLGWLGEPTFLKIVEPIMLEFSIPKSLAHIISFIIAFSIITYLNVVIGELFPKSVAIRSAEQLTLVLSKPLYWFYKIMFPFIWILNHASMLVARLYGIKHPTNTEEAPSEEELQLILAESFQNGEINQTEYRYVNRIFEFDNRLANEIMIPRTEMVTLSVESSLEEVLHIVQKERFTRYPMTKDNDKDNILGFIHIKQLLTDCIRNNCTGTEPLKKYIQPVIRVMEFIPIQLLLLTMQKERVSIAILHDEFGGTAGLVTVEDILEEIVGEIRDEFDEDELPYIQKIKEDSYILDSKLSLHEVNSVLSTTLEHDDIHTLGGWILSQNPNLKKGEVIHHQGYDFQINKMAKQHILSFNAIKK